jgi:hypothetical protein
MSKGQICGIAVTLMLVVGVPSWIFTAPDMSSQGRALSNQGFDRMPGVISVGR